ncbi:MAG: dockerin type I repeat-containing protein, partial [Anaeroplasmataceae bacterium]|nr:dockerin type I repeat-containing protein [Anaeroplasmataceae bacterium]
FNNVEVKEEGNPRGRLYAGYNTYLEYTITPFSVPSILTFYRNGKIAFNTTEIGVYTVEIVVKDTMNYFGFVRTFEYEISRNEMPLDILASYAIQPFTGRPVENPKVLAPIEINEDNATFTYYDAAGNELPSKPVNVGKYSVTISVEGNEYYLPTTKNFAFEIIESSLVVFWEGESTYYYNGLAQHPTAYTFDLNNHRIELEITYDSLGQPILAKNYVATAVLPEGFENYKVVNNSFEFKILPRNINVLIFNDYVLVADTDYTAQISEASNLASGDIITLEYRLAAAKRIRGSVYDSINDIIIDHLAILSGDEDVTDSYAIHYSVHLEVYLPRIEYQFVGAEFDGLEYVYKKDYDGIALTPELEVFTEAAEGEELIIEFNPVDFIDSGKYSLPYRIRIGYYEDDQFILTHEPVMGTVRVNIDRIEYKIEVTEELSKPYDGVQVFPKISVNDIMRSDAEFHFPCFIDFYQSDILLDGAPVNAGKYTIVITVYSSGNYKTTQYSLEFEISKAMSGITLNNDETSLYDYTKQYNGEAFTHAVRGTDNSANLQYEVIGDGHVEVCYFDANGQRISAPVNAGIYYVQFVVDETLSYQAYVSPKYTIEITKIFIFVGTTDYHYTKYYDGERVSVDVSQFTILKQEFIMEQLGQTDFFNIVGTTLVEDVNSRFALSGFIYTASASQGVYSFGPDFDTTHIIITDAETGEDLTKNYQIYALCDIEIKAEQVEVTCDDVVVDYDGNAYTIDPRPAKNIKDYEVLYSYDGVLYQHTPIRYADCGEYTIYYKLVFENYEDVEGSATLTINKVDTATLQIIGSLDSIYTGFAVKDPMYSSNTIGEVTYTWYQLVNGDYVEVESAIHVGHYKVKVTLAETQNYFGTDAELAFEITPKEVSIGWVNTELTYTGSAQYPIPYFVGGIADDLEIVVTVDGDATQRGTYTAHARINDMYGDYIVDEASAQTTYTISHKLVDVLATMERDYTGRDIQINVNKYYTASQSSVRNVGEYEITVSLLDKDNYKWKVISADGTYEITDSEDMTIVMTVLPADINNAVFAAIADQPYTGKAITPKTTVSFNGINLVQGVDYEYSYENNIEIGTEAIVRITACEGGNFKNSHDVFFTIEKTTIGVAEGSGYEFIYAKTSTTFEADEHKIYSASRRIIINNVSANTTIEDFLNNLTKKDNQEFVVYNASGTLVRDTQYKIQLVGTGFRIQLKEGNYVKDNVYVSVIGDLTGDGLINANDTTRIQRHLLGTSKLTNENLLAADVNRDGKVDSADQAALRQLY